MAALFAFQACRNLRSLCKRQNQAMQITAILSALAQEQRGLIALLQQPTQVSHAGRDFWLGDLQGQRVVLALSKIGKVAAATTSAALIERFGAQRIVFTGVAGGLGDGVKVGDVVVATDFIQHDLDVSPLFARYEVPSYGRARFDGDATLSVLLFNAARSALQGRGSIATYPGATVHQGLIASGDRFVSGAGESLALRATLASAGHEVLAVEMECAAVAQVCYDYGIPFAAVRTISDRADDDAHVDFQVFLEQVASQYTSAIITNLFQLL